MAEGLDVMVLDDDPGMSQVLKELIESFYSWGSVVAFSKAEKAMDWCQKRDANFISNDVHTGVAGALTWDGLVNLIFALPEQYDHNAIVVMNKASGGLNLAKLVDGDGRPYWSLGNSGLVDQGINRPLLGYPVLFNGFMPNVTAALYPIIFGHCRGYYLVNRVGFSIQVLRELYAETNQIVLLGRVRFGGQLVEDWRVRGHVASA